MILVFALQCRTGALGLRMIVFLVFSAVMLCGAAMNAFGIQISEKEESIAHVSQAEQATADKENLLITMAIHCPFKRDSTFEECKKLMVKNRLARWKFLMLGSALRTPEGDDELRLQPLWESNVNELPIFAQFKNKRSGADRATNEITGQLRLRFVNDRLMEVVFQEGGPGLLLGFSRIIEPSPVSGTLNNESDNK